MNSVKADESIKKNMSDSNEPDSNELVEITDVLRSDVSSWSAKVTRKDDSYNIQVSSLSSLISSYK